MSLLLTREDINEHVFALSGLGENGLGIVAHSANSVEIEEVCIQQSLSLLHQHSTGAVVWKATPKFAKWLPTSPIGDLVRHKTVVELGSGTGALALLLADYVRHFILTDQKPLLKLARRNCEGLANVTLEEFDWETQEFRGIEEDGVLIACDTIYNDFLIKPFTDAVLSVLNASPFILNVIVCIQVRDLHVLESALTNFSKHFRITYYEIERGFAAYVLSV